MRSGAERRASHRSEAGTPRSGARAVFIAFVRSLALRTRTQHSASECELRTCNSTQLLHVYSHSVQCTHSYSYTYSMPSGHSGRRFPGCQRPLPLPNSVRFSYAVSHTTHAFNKLKRSTLFSSPQISSHLFSSICIHQINEILSQLVAYKVRKIKFTVYRLVTRQIKQ